MTGQIVEITDPGFYLSKTRGFLEVSCAKDGQSSQIPLDDILAVLISVPGCTITTVLIDDLCQRDIPVVICGPNYLPSSLILPVEGHGRQFKTMQAQMEMSIPRRKKAWQRIIKAKIANQADVLELVDAKNNQLERLAKSVRSGDSDNCEAQAARIYWQQIFGSKFRRDRNLRGLNASLNYVYAIVRATVARGIVSAGLHPTFSVHHRNPQNSLNLVDDLMEPLRPVADYLIWQIGSEKLGKLTPELKSMLASITSINTPLFEDKNFMELSPLSLTAVKMSRSFANYCQGEQDAFLTPKIPTPLDYQTSL